MRARVAIAFVVGLGLSGCIGPGGLIGLELSGEGGESGEQDTGESTGEDGDETGGGDAGLDCDMDEEAPVLSLASPADLTQGIAPDTVFSLALNDPCGVDEDSVLVRVNGEVVETSAQTNDGLTLVQWPGAHELDERLVVEVMAADVSGNVLETQLDYRVWDIVEWLVFPDPECNEGCPGMAGPREADPNGSAAPLPDQTFPVGGVEGGRTVLVLNPAPLPEPAGTVVARAELELGSSVQSDVVRTLVCHELSVDFDPAAVTWNERRPGSPWAEPGAMAVPQDHGAQQVASVTWDGEVGEFEPIAGELAADVAEKWLEEASTGLWCAGPDMPIFVLSPASNVPPRVRVFVGRPL